MARRKGNGVEIHYFGARIRYGAVGTNETHQNSMIQIESQNPGCAKIIQRLQGYHHYQMNQDFLFSNYKVDQ